MASFNMKDKYTSLELMGISENLRNQGTVLSWRDSDHQLADGLTKATKQDPQEVLAAGTLETETSRCLMSAKRRRALDATEKNDSPCVQPVASSTYSLSIRV